ncbi:aldolase, partial [Mycobacterium tuberculosis]|nr:aldolase [Mycobacterium tuberculosis]
ALLRIRSSADSAGIVPGIHCGDGAEANLRRDEGYRLITSALDIGAAARALRADLDTARA